MKSFIVLAVLVAAALAAPANPDADAVVVKSNLDNIGVDGFLYAYETSNGIREEAQGQLTDVGTDDEGISVRGSFSYVGNDGQTYTITYTADKDGYKPQGAHIPQ